MSILFSYTYEFLVGLSRRAVGSEHSWFVLQSSDNWSHGGAAQDDEVSARSERRLQSIAGVTEQWPSGRGWMPNGVMFTKAELRRDEQRLLHMRLVHDQKSAK